MLSIDTNILLHAFKTLQKWMAATLLPLSPND